MVTISLHYWAGAKAAAGVAEEQVEADTVAAALELARSSRSDPRFDRVLSACSLLIDGLVAKHSDLDRSLSAPVRVEILPPFAGGRGAERLTMRPLVSISDTRHGVGGRAG